MERKFRAGQKVHYWVKGSPTKKAYFGCKSLFICEISEDIDEVTCQECLKNHTQLLLF